MTWWLLVQGMADPSLPAVVPELVSPCVSWNEERSGYPASFPRRSVMPQRKSKFIEVEKTPKVVPFGMFLVS